MHSYLFLIAFNLATKAVNSASENKRIMVEIDRIYQEVDKLVFSITRLDIHFATRLRNMTIAVEVRKRLCC